MGNRPTKLLCIWHVDRAWRENLRQKIGDVDTQSQIYKIARIVLEQTDVNQFDTKLHHMIQVLQQKSNTQEFCDYFISEWVSKNKEWAYCHRVGLGINTNMFVEAFHRVFNHVYLKGKSNKWVDGYLIKLVKFARDKFFERLITLTKGKASTRMKTIHERHNKSLTLSADLVN